MHTLKTIIEDVKDIITNNSINIQSVEYTGEIDVNMTLDKDFPKVYMIADESGELGDNINTMVVTFRFVDIQKGLNNEWIRDYEIKSDMQLEASMMVDKLQSLGYSINLPITFEMLSGVFNDGLAGIQFNISFNLEKPCYEV